MKPHVICHMVASVDGRTLYFHRMVPLTAMRWGIYRIAPDGTGLTGLTTSAPGNNEYPSN